MLDPNYQPPADYRWQRHPLTMGKSGPDDPVIPDVVPAEAGVPWWALALLGAAGLWFFFVKDKDKGKK